MTKTDGEDDGEESGGTGAPQGNKIACNREVSAPIARTVAGALIVIIFKCCEKFCFVHFHNNHNNHNKKYQSRRWLVVGTK